MESEGNLSLPVRSGSEGLDSLSTLLERAVRQGADREAIVTKTVRLGYGRLKEEVDHLTLALRESGVRRGERVGILLPNVSEFVIAFWGTAGADAIAVPIHTKFQADEIGRYVRDCEIGVLLADRRLEGIIRSLEGNGFGPFRVFWRDEGKVGFTPAVRGLSRSTGPGPNPPRMPSGDLPVLSQYSTGSTGGPKRVTRTHRDLLIETENVIRTVGIRSSDRILGAAPLFHAYGFVNAMLCAIGAGATLVTVEEFVPRDLLRLIASERITGFPGVPFMFKMLAETFLREGMDLSSLRYCISAGAPLPPETAEAFRQRFGIAVHQLYGTTETGVISINRGKAADHAAGSVGTSIPGVVVTITGDEGDPLPQGVEGNVAVQSETAAREYDRAIAGSETVFRSGFFYPGDIGRIDQDGRLYLVGRKRFFINVGGNKVDPSDVEAVLLEHPLVREAVVVGVPNGASGEIVKAVVVTSSPCAAVDLLEHCRGRLAEHKRPRLIQFRAEIPKSPLGKVLRKYLIEV